MLMHARQVLFLSYPPKGNGFSIVCNIFWETTMFFLQAVHFSKGTTGFSGLAKVLTRDKA